MRVRDETLLPVLRALFASFDPPLSAAVRLVGASEPAEAEIGRVVPGTPGTAGASADGSRLPSVADFSGVSRRIFATVYPEFRWTAVATEPLAAAAAGRAPARGDGEARVAGAAVTCLALETVFWGLSSENKGPDRARTLAQSGDPARLRELEARFGVALYPEADALAARADRRYLEAEDILLRSGTATLVASSPTRPAALAAPLGRLLDPRDPERVRMSAPRKEAEREAETQGVALAPGAALRLAVGSDPPRDWYVLPEGDEEDEEDERGISLSPWAPVRFDRGLDPLGHTPGGRAVWAARAPARALEGGRGPRAGDLVGDRAAGVFGELRETRAGSQVVLGARPEGEPPHDPEVTRMAQTARVADGPGRGHRPGFACFGSPGVLSEAACEVVGGVWDRPCTRDYECPYFSGDARGGCVAGACEMPLGVNNAAFTVARGEPVCLGCGAAGDPVRCCDAMPAHRRKYAWR